MGLTPDLSALQRAYSAVARGQVCGGPTGRTYAVTKLFMESGVPK